MPGGHAGEYRLPLHVPLRSHYPLSWSATCYGIQSPAPLNPSPSESIVCSVLANLFGDPPPPPPTPGPDQGREERNQRAVSASTVPRGMSAPQSVSSQASPSAPLQKRSNCRHREAPRRALYQAFDDLA